jgi:hypothetical protein
MAGWWIGVSPGKSVPGVSVMSIAIVLNRPYLPAS